MDVPVLRALAVDAGGSILILQAFARRSSETMNDQLWSDSKLSISGLPSIEFVTLRQDITWHASSSGTRTILVRISTRNVLGIMSPISLNGYNRFCVANCFTPVIVQPTIRSRADGAAGGCVCIDECPFILQAWCDNELVLFSW